MPDAVLGLETEDIKNHLGSILPGYRAAQLYTALYQQRVRAWEDVTTLTRQARAELAAAYVVGWPELQQRFESTDGTRRYLLRLIDGKTVEAVLMPEGARNTICVSTQVGCPVDCKFCLTALMGLERNLTAGEIVGQILYVLEDNQLTGGLQRINIVFMGMGEPLLNLPNVLKATRILTDVKGVGLSPRRITLSTSGIIPRISELGAAPVRPKLAISLNASSDVARRELMPITRKYSLSALLEACRAYPLRSWEKLTFEYVLLRDVNDTDADARRVVRLLANLNCIVNLIALNPGPGIPFGTPDPQRVDAFQRIVQKAMPCFVRKPRGRDVYAACGQLKRVSQAEIEQFPILVNA
ncbi:MAG: 23S rRNA (adenine(2503)-C(2))-methyltransferase RlmN [Bryobacterales bacterium]|jgi:23S rRNA (adenine2503-C2)-methyltransferase|nr:23S rRNA (adenine(2503)-C(2))-methyltransferase RlmN [Bryobacterales bacterium]